MATAQFPADYVFNAAMERIVNLESQRDAVREKRIMGLMEKEVVTEGHLWWRRRRKRTREEAERYYSVAVGYRDSVQYWAEMPHRAGIKAVVPLQRLAEAVLKQAGNGMLTLTPEDCAILDIPFGFRGAA